MNASRSVAAIVTRGDINCSFLTHNTIDRKTLRPQLVPRCLQQLTKEESVGDPTSFKNEISNSLTNLQPINCIKFIAAHIQGMLLATVVCEWLDTARHAPALLLLLWNAVRVGTAIQQQGTNLSQFCRLKDKEPFGIQQFNGVRNELAGCDSG